jgi:tetratricopeptide (TPR) repeat protein
MAKLFVSSMFLFATIAAGYAQLATETARREAFKHYRAGQEFMSAEQWEKAAAEFEAAIRLDRLFTDAHFGLGQAYMGLQRFASAVRAFEGCLEAARDVHALRDADRVNGDKQIDDEIRELRETIRQMAAQTGRELRRTQLEQRVTDLQNSRSSLGKPFEPPAGVLLSLGSAHFRNGNVAAAEVSWTDAVRVNSKLGEGWNNLAVIYLRSGRKAQAEQAVSNAERAGFRVNPRLKDDIKAMK